MLPWLLAFGALGGDLPLCPFLGSEGYAAAHAALAAEAAAEARALDAEEAALRAEYELRLAGHRERLVILTADDAKALLSGPSPGLTVGAETCLGSVGCVTVLELGPDAEGFVGPLELQVARRGVGTVPARGPAGRGRIVLGSPPAGWRVSAMYVAALDELAHCANWRAGGDLPTDGAAPDVPLPELAPIQLRPNPIACDPGELSLADQAVRRAMSRLEVKLANPSARRGDVRRDLARASAQRIAAWSEVPSVETVRAAALAVPGATAADVSCTPFGCSLLVTSSIIGTPVQAALADALGPAVRLVRQSGARSDTPGETVNAWAILSPAASDEAKLRLEVRGECLLVGRPVDPQ